MKIPSQANIFFPLILNSDIHRVSLHAFLMLAITLVSHPVLADVLIMRNGDQITGEVINKENNILHYKTPYAGILEIEWDEVSELKTDKPVKLMLEDNELLSTDTIINSQDSTLIKSATTEETRTIKRTALTHINPESWQTGNGYKFSGKVNLAIEYERGNTDSDEIDMDAELVLRRKNDRFRFFLDLENDKALGITTKDKWYVNGKYDYFINPRKYYWGGLRLESDAFADLSLRSGAGGGIGYIFYNSKRLNLSGELGGSWVFEEFSSQENNDYPALNWSLDFDKYVFTDFTQVYHRNTGFQGLENLDDVVIKTWTGLRFLLPRGFIASLEAQIEFDNTPAIDKDRIDNTYAIKFGYGW